MLNEYLKQTSKSLFFVSCVLILSACSSSSEITSKQWYSLDNYASERPQCFNRATMPYTSVVDSHNHFRPFGGKAIPFPELNQYFTNLGVLFVNIYGIGQSLPIDSGCEYYLDCPNVPANPSIKNDFANALNYLEHPPQKVNMILAMSFADLAQPDTILAQMDLLDKEFPNLFKWVGEVNLVKQALFNNGHSATPVEVIPKWQPVMQRLKTRNMPIAIHSDMGNNENATQYLFLMEEVLSQYPENKIVWVHMGLSKELTNVDPVAHIQILKRLLDTYPNLVLDISWRVIEDTYFSKPDIRSHYVAFFNEYPTRILQGTDFVASRKKDFSVYQAELEATSRINQYLTDEAFRYIALGQNYLDFIGLNQYQAPPVCQ